MEENNQVVVDTTNVVEMKPYTFRKLCAKDIPLMLKILKKIEINKFADCFQSEHVQKLIANATNGGTENLNLVAGSAVFLEIAQIIISGISECGDDIFKMLSEASNLTLEQVKELDFDVFTQMVIDFIKKDEFVGFIKAVSKLLNMEN